MSWGASERAAASRDRSGRRAHRWPGRTVRRAALAVAVLAAGCTGPILPARTKPGGAARWAASLGWSKALQWSQDATLVRVAGAGVGIEGWLPDRGGEWTMTYASAAKALRLEVRVDSDGAVRERELSAGTATPALPANWVDSSKIWQAARAHWRSEPLHTLDAELAAGTEPERYPGQVVWRIRFWLADSKIENHVVTPDGRWLTAY